jgi:hypothetical protein
MKNIAMAIGASVLLAACAAPVKHEFIKDGASAEDKTGAMTECAHQIKLSKKLPPVSTELKITCMQDKGFLYKSVS